MDKPSEFREPRLITKTEAARRLGIGRPTLYRWIADHGFPVVRVGEREYIDIQDIEAYIENQKTGGWEADAY